MKPLAGLGAALILAAGAPASPHPPRPPLYLISDDNFASSQRTLLLAFDWRPPDER